MVAEPGVAVKKPRRGCQRKRLLRHPHEVALANELHDPQPMPRPPTASPHALFDGRQGEFEQTVRSPASMSQNKGSVKRLSEALPQSASPPAFPKTSERVTEGSEPPTHDTPGPAALYAITERRTVGDGVPTA